jgi:uncharacterized glyoxalase superfamily protein PhnB
MRTSTPDLFCARADDTFAFYKPAFDAVEVMRFPGLDCKPLHAEIKIAQ